jgi:hypothetical protein
MTGARWVLSVAGLIAGVGLCACGSTNNSGTVTDAASQLALAQCMRSHGVPNFPDPSSGGGFSVVASPGSSNLTIDGVAFGGPAFESAVKTCKLLGGGTSPPPLSASQKQKRLAFAQCMRTHGVPNYPDPTFRPISERKLLSALNTSSPAFQKANRACGRGE